MGVIEIIGGIVLLLACVCISVAVVLQESPKGGGISALGGGDSYFSKNQARTKDVMLSKVTKILTIVFFIVTLVVYALSIWMK
ncbi:MAG: preprotein translocase subunit SecG [Oscillospiraceae bacterium]